jgi:hypothetical protein
VATEVVVFPDTDVQITLLDVKVEAKALENVVARAGPAGYLLLSGVLMLIAGGNMLKRRIHIK